MASYVRTFGKPTMNRTQVQLWYNRFKECRENLNYDARPSRPSTSTTVEDIEAVKKKDLLETLLIMLAYRSTHAKQFLWMF